MTAPVGDYEREGARYTEKGEEGEVVEMSDDQVLLQRIRSMLRDTLAVRKLYCEIENSIFGLM